VAEILRMAGEESCDLIVMGTHGRTGLGRLLMGSVAEHIVRKAPCLVLTLKSPTPSQDTFPPASKRRPMPV
jgi:nucleotide-binding universal stress UspA family protein